jgi:hypothetical protein
LSIKTKLGAVLTSKAKELTTPRLVVHATKALVPCMKYKVIMAIVPSEERALGEQIDDLKSPWTPWSSKSSFLWKEGCV